MGNAIVYLKRVKIDLISLNSSLAHGKAKDLKKEENDLKFFDLTRIAYIRLMALNGMEMLPPTTALCMYVKTIG